MTHFEPEDNCQQRSTPKAAHKSLLACLALSFNGGSHTEMAYLHQTVKRKEEMFTAWSIPCSILCGKVEIGYQKIETLCFVFCVLLLLFFCFFLAVMENHYKLILMKSSVISFIYRAPSPDFEFSHSDLQK